MNTPVPNLVWIVAGAAVGLFGWMIYWLGLPVVGGVLGASMGGSLGYLGAELLQTPNATPLLVGAGALVGAVAGVLLIRALQIYFFFAIGASLGGTVAHRLLTVGPLTALPGASEGWGLTLGVVLSAIVVGLLLVRLRRFLVAVVTSLIGATLVRQGLPPQWMEVGWLICLLIFLAVQTGLVHRYIDNERFDGARPIYRSRAHGQYREDED